MVILRNNSNTLQTDRGSSDLCPPALRHHSTQEAKPLWFLLTAPPKPTPEALPLKSQTESKSGLKVGKTKRGMTPWALLCPSLAAVAHLHRD